MRTACISVAPLWYFSRRRPANAWKVERSVSSSPASHLHRAKNDDRPNSFHWELRMWNERNKDSTWSTPKFISRLQRLQRLFTDIYSTWMYLKLKYLSCSRSIKTRRPQPPAVGQHRPFKPSFEHPGDFSHAPPALSASASFLRMWSVLQRKSQLCLTCLMSTVEYEAASLDNLDSMPMFSTFLGNARVTMVSGVGQHAVLVLPAQLPALLSRPQRPAKSVSLKWFHRFFPSSPVPMLACTYLKFIGVTPVATLPVQYVQNKSLANTKESEASWISPSVVGVVVVVVS